MPNSISIKSIVVAGKDQIACSLGEEAAILHISKGLYYGLDPVGARIWNLLQHPRPVEEIRETIVAEYDVSPEQCEADLLGLLEMLQSEDLIQVQDGAAA